MDLTGPFPKMTDADSVYAIKDYSERMAAALVPTARVEPALTNGWTQWRLGGWNGISMQRIGKLAIISGAAGKGTWGAGDIIANLPAAWRPPAKVMGVNCEVESNGNLKTAGPQASGADAIVLSITFFTV